MKDLTTMLQEIQQAAHDPVAVDQARQKLVADHDANPAASDAVTEALYRLGVTTLMRNKDLAAAMALFKRAADKKNPHWSPLARTSYALTLQAKGRHQQAVFELRKVVGSATPSPATATALCCLCLVLRDGRAKPSEIEKADKDRMAVLQSLVQASQDGTEDAAHWRHQLALAHKEGGSRAECKRQLETVVSWKERAGEATLAAATDMLKHM
jgi:hypothetical protein